MRKTGPREADNRTGTMPDKEYPLLVLVYITRRPDFKKRMSELIKEARLDGIRTMTIERLLSFSGNRTGSQAVSKP
jgi:hypothetical protein